MISRKSRFATARKKAAESLILGALFLVIFGGISGFLSISNIIMNEKRSDLTKREEELKTQLEDLQAVKQELEKNIGEAQTPEYQEKVLREQGLYKKPGEQVITILPEEQKQQEQPEKKRVWWDPRTWFSRD